jgi:hypothetical protein
MTGRNPLGNGREPQSYEGLNVVVPLSGWQLVLSKGTAARSPTTNDKKYPLGSMWVNTGNNTVWSLTSISGGSATWTELDNSGGTGTFTTLTVTTALNMSDGANMVFGTTTGTQIGTAASQKLGFYGKTPVIQQTQGALTNSVTAGGVTGTIANYTDLSVYANDAAAIRNDIYQLALALSGTITALRAQGLIA